MLRIAKGLHTPCFHPGGLRPNSSRGAECQGLGCRVWAACSGVPAAHQATVGASITAWSYIPNTARLFDTSNNIPQHDIGNLPASVLDATLLRGQVAQVLAHLPLTASQSRGGLLKVK